MRRMSKTRGRRDLNQRRYQRWCRMVLRRTLEMAHAHR